ncbi:MAG: RiPP maturation radical SAM C-methyltransferase [Terriglobales bacterium]
MLRPADVLLVVPPFGGLNKLSFGVHLLQACGRKAGFRVQVLYANLLLARIIGERAYEEIYACSLSSFAGERFFARCAYGVPPLGRHSDKMFDWAWVVSDADDGPAIEPNFAGERPMRLGKLRRLEARAEEFIDALARAITGLSYKIVGCTTSFEQTSASVALLNRIKLFNEDTVTILGGANCEDQMACGIASLRGRIDYIFSGDSETTFVESVWAILAGSPPRERIIRGAPCANMDALPTPVFTDFYEQRRRLLPGSATSEEDTELLYETSRGCWRGQKQHCTFCGFAGKNIVFRQKSPARVMEELHSLLHAHPARKVVMTDNLMPYNYFETLIPRLASELPQHSICYTQRADLPLAKVLALKKAGINSVEPGIEALSSRLLRLLRKGIQARQNLMFLRWARTAGIQLVWNLLWGFPGDEIEAYQETLAIVPLLHHLQPPAALLHLVIDRFSPYFSRPAEFGVRNIKPIVAYYDFLPRTADVRRIAYHFTADYASGAHSRLDVIRELWREVERWHAAWAQGNCQPLEDLRISQNDGRYVLIDTRRVVGTRKTYVLDQTEASFLVAARPYSGSQVEAWALEQRVALLIDAWFVPLPVADANTFSALMDEPPWCPHLSRFSQGRETAGLQR